MENTDNKVVFFYPVYTDHFGNIPLNKEGYPTAIGVPRVTARHAAWDASKVVKHVPPIGGFKIYTMVVPAKRVLEIINKIEYSNLNETNLFEL